MTLQGHAAGAARRFRRRMAGGSGAAVSCRNVTVRFVTDRRTVTALENVSFEVEQGGFLSLLGPSGCGKSTLLRVVADLIAPSVAVLPSSACRRRRRGAAARSASCSRMPRCCPGAPRCRTSNCRSRSAARARHAQGADAARTAEAGGPGRLGKQLLRTNSPAACASAYPSPAHSSAGRALLLMDEPFGALDEITRDRLNEELRRIWQETGTTIMFVTHSVYEAAFLGEQVLVLAANPGRVSELVDDRPAARPHAGASARPHRFVRIAAQPARLPGEGRMTSTTDLTAAIGRQRAVPDRARLAGRDAAG